MQAIRLHKWKGKDVYTTEFRLICSLKNETAFKATVKKNSLRASFFFNVTEMGFHPGWCMKVTLSVRSQIATVTVNSRLFFGKKQVKCYLQHLFKREVLSC